MIWFTSLPLFTMLAIQSAGRLGKRVNWSLVWDGCAAPQFRRWASSSQPLGPRRAIRKSLTLAVVLAISLFLPAIEAQAQINKCMINGTITYQSHPCPSGETAKRPTVERLNTERDKRLQQAREGTANQSEPTHGREQPQSPGVQSGSAVWNGQEHRHSAAPRTASPAIAFNCDGRTYCSQMTSCTEAKSFLAHCPGVKMDGNRDAIPCERQWCSN